MIPEVHDQSTPQILLRQTCLPCPESLAKRLKIFSQLLRIRPRDETALPTESVDDKVRAIGPPPRLRPRVGGGGQFTAAKEVRQAELLGEGRPEAGAGEAANLNGRRFPYPASDFYPRLHSHRAKIFCRYRLACHAGAMRRRADAVERKRRATSQQPNLTPSRPRRRAAREAN